MWVRSVTLCSCRVIGPIYVWNEVTGLSGLGDLKRSAVSIPSNWGSGRLTYSLCPVIDGGMTVLRTHEWVTSSAVSTMWTVGINVLSDVDGNCTTLSLQRFRSFPRLDTRGLDGGMEWIYEEHALRGATFYRLENVIRVHENPEHDKYHSTLCEESVFTHSLVRNAPRSCPSFWFV